MIHYWNHSNEIAMSFGLATIMTISKGHVEFETDGYWRFIDIDIYDMCCLFALWEEVYG